MNLNKFQREKRTSGIMKINIYLNVRRENMKNIFEVSPESHYQFEWDKLGNIKKGREHLGEEMPVLVYRLLEYSMNDVLFKNFGIAS